MRPELAIERLFNEHADDDGEEENDVEGEEKEDEDVGEIMLLLLEVCFNVDINTAVVALVVVIDGH